jgi:hypothetical protein
MTKLAAISMAGAMLVMAGATHAKAECARPSPPTVVNGATATLEELQASKTAVTDFMVASDAYQTCVIEELDAQRAADKAAKKKINPDLAKTASDKTSDSQADKVKVGAAYNAAAKAYRAAHPPT